MIPERFGRRILTRQPSLRPHADIADNPLPCGMPEPPKTAARKNGGGHVAGAELTRMGRWTVRGASMKPYPRNPAHLSLLASR